MNPSVAVDPNARLAAERQAARRLEFDVCHAGVSLRTLLFVHGTVAIGLLPGCETGLQWIGLVSLSCAVVLPASLVWLLVMCVCKPWLAGRPSALRWVFAVGLGASVGGLAGLGWSALRLVTDAVAAPAPGMTPWGGSGVGAGLAAAVFHWLQQRVRLLASPATVARLAELQSRIRPHFLFNALNSAIALVDAHPERAEQVLEDLAALFRAALSEQRDQVSLADELDLAQRYLAIEQVRFGERLSVQWDVEAAAGAAQVPPLVLQPLVENAVKHGVEQGADPAEVRVQVRRLADGRVELLIRNRLPRRPATADVEPVQGPGRSQGQGMALANVRERLTLLHDLTMGFEAGVAADGWWQVRILLPQGRALSKPAGAAA